VAIPLIAGPSAITYVMLLMKSDPSRSLEWVGEIFAAILVTMVAFFLSGKLKEWLGPRALSAIERLMGLVLTAIAMEMLLGGLAVLGPKRMDYALLLPLVHLVAEQLNEALERLA